MTSDRPPLYLGPASGATAADKARFFRLSSTSGGCRGPAMLLGRQRGHWEG